MKSSNPWWWNYPHNITLLHSMADRTSMTSPYIESEGSMISVGKYCSHCGKEIEKCGCRDQAVTISIRVPSRYPEPKIHMSSERCHKCGHTTNTCCCYHEKERCHKCGHTTNTCCCDYCHYYWHRTTIIIRICRQAKAIYCNSLKISIRYQIKARTLCTNVENVRRANFLIME